MLAPEQAVGGPPTTTGIKCRCGKVARSATVRKPGPNQNRSFFACPEFDQSEQCNFFQWAEGSPPPSGQVSAVSHTHASAATTHTVGGTAQQSYLGLKQPHVERHPATKMTFAVLSAEHAALSCAYRSDIVQLCGVHGGVFDADRREWRFPVAAYPALVRAASTLPNVTVEAIPPFVLEQLAAQQAQAAHGAGGAAAAAAGAGGSLSAAGSAGSGRNGAAGARGGVLSSDPQPPAAASPEPLRLPTRLARCLLPFQTEGVRFIVGKGGRAICADEMGCGKTFTAMATAAHYAEEWPLLVLCPSSLRLNWREELLKWLPGLTDAHARAAASANTLTVIAKAGDAIPTRRGCGAAAAALPAAGASSLPSGHHYGHADYGTDGEGAGGARGGGRGRRAAPAAAGDAQGEGEEAEEELIDLTDEPDRTAMDADGGAGSNTGKGKGKGKGRGKRAALTEKKAAAAGAGTAGRGGGKSKLAGARGVVLSDDGEESEAAADAAGSAAGTRGSGGGSAVVRRQGRPEPGSPFDDPARYCGGVVIMSYEMVAPFVESGRLRPGMFPVVVADESHYLKSAEARRTRAALPLLQGARRALLLTGTPALNRPKELFTQVAAVRPRLFGDYRAFATRYCAAGDRPWGFDDRGASNLDELRTLLEGQCMVRRRKADILRSLPPKARRVVRVALTDGAQAQMGRLRVELQKVEEAVRAAASEAEREMLGHRKQGIMGSMYRCVSGEQGGGCRSGGGRPVEGASLRASRLCEGWLEELAWVPRVRTRECRCGTAPWAPQLNRERAASLRRSQQRIGLAPWHITPQSTAASVSSPRPPVSASLTPLPLHSPPRTHTPPSPSLAERHRQAACRGALHHQSAQAAAARARCRRRGA